MPPYVTSKRVLLLKRICDCRVMGGGGGGGGSIFGIFFVTS